MGIKINYGNGVLVIPKEALSVFNRAKKEDIELLLNICSHEGEVCCNESMDTLAELCGVSRAEVEKSLAFWYGTGIIELSNENKSVKKSVVKEKSDISSDKKTDKLISTDELPKYSSEELANLLENRKSYVDLINECQNTIGKIFNQHEISILLGLCDYLSLDNEYILLLCAHAVKMGKPSMHYIEKQAFSLYNDGIVLADVLEERLKNIEDMAENESEIRSMFGMKSRSLTAKEKKYISEWLGKYKFNASMIRLAYEITVDKINEPSINYTNAILTRWYENDIKTPKDAENAMAEHKSGSDNTTAFNSFDTDEFFAAALKHGYEKYGNGGKDGV